MGFDVLHIAKRILLSDQTVSIPGLGVFFLRRSAAKVNRSTHQFDPPKVDLNFKWKPETRGERLKEILISDYGLDEVAADQAIRRFADQVMDEYYATGFAEIHGLGRIYRDGNGNMIYNAEQADHIFTVSNLPSYRLTPIERKSEEDIARVEQLIADREMASAREVEAGSSATIQHSESSPDDDWAALDEELPEVPDIPEKETDLHETVSEVELTSPEIEKIKIPQEEPAEVVIPVVAIDNTKVSQHAPRQVHPPIQEKKRNPIWWLLLIPLLLLLAYFWMNRDTQRHAAEDPVVTTTTDSDQSNTDNPEENVEITDSISSGITPVDATPEEQSSEVVENNNTENTEDTPSETSSEPEQTLRIDGHEPRLINGECVIIVGAFGRQANVEKVSQRIKDLGYGVHTLTYGSGVTRVGAQLNCNQAENALSELRNKIEPQAWILH